METKAINAIRMLGVDAINQANSGHPGIVLGAAPMAYTLFTNHLNLHIKQPKWMNRDRFILSAGHGSMLLYALNHLIGYKITMNDLKNFRQIGNTPGHPEYGHTDGVETTSGPLGQGISNAVGMAIAEEHLAERFNKEGFSVVDHHTYVICGDGDLQEGVALEAMSLAGHLGLGKLIVLFDSNNIQLRW
jgi:transketolase